MTQEALKKMQWHVLTQAQYDALETKNANDVYAIVDDKGDYTETKLNKMIFNVMSADTYKALETKDPNQIYYVTGENESIAHKSWTDGSQTSVTPAGFVDDGYRRFYMETLDDDGNRVTPSVDPSVYGADTYELITVTEASDDKVHFSGLFNNLGISHNDSTACIIDGAYTPATSLDWDNTYLPTSAYWRCYTIDLTQLANLDYFYELSYCAYQSSISSSGSVTDESTTIEINTSSYVFFILYYIDDDGNKIARMFFANSTNNTDTDSYLEGTVFPYLACYKKVYLTFYIDFWVHQDNDMVQSEVIIHPTDSVRSSTSITKQTSDYNTITSELTARGNTITSLNTQGQNLVSAYNNLADKYNTAGIIVTGD
jgi:hypothetical protein